MVCAKLAHQWGNLRKINAVLFSDGINLIEESFCLNIKEIAQRSCKIYLIVNNGKTLNRH